ncbi:hypothetical protein D910_00744, partial [Dendroctonus ponderosae]
MVAESDTVICLERHCQGAHHEGVDCSKPEYEINNNSDNFGTNGEYGRNAVMVRKSNAIQYRTIQDPASQRLTWYKPPLTVLVIKKVRDATVYSPFVKLVQWLIQVSKR